MVRDYCTKTYARPVYHSYRHPFITKDYLPKYNWFSVWRSQVVSGDRNHNVIAFTNNVYSKTTVLPHDCVQRYA